jgi:hypothetical protein
VLGLRTPMGFAAVRMASEAILNVRDMIRTVRPVDYSIRTLRCFAMGYCNSAVTRNARAEVFTYVIFHRRWLKLD